MPLAYLCRVLQTIIFSAKFDQLPLKALKKKKKKMFILLSHCYKKAKLTTSQISLAFLSFQ